MIICLSVSVHAALHFIMHAFVTFLGPLVWVGLTSERDGSPDSASESLDSRKSMSQRFGE